jgi:hypothetical protein
LPAGTGLAKSAKIAQTCADARAGLLRTSLRFLTWACVVRSEKASLGSNGAAASRSIRSNSTNAPMAATMSAPLTAASANTLASDKKAM